MKKLLLLISCFCACAVYGQNALRPNIYFENMNYYNPSSGLEDTAVDFQFSLYGKQKFIRNDVWNKPATLFLNHLGRTTRVPGFYSAAYIFDRYSFYDRHTLYAGYTYQWKLPGTQVLSMGARGVFNFDHIRWEELPQVRNKPGTTSYFTPDADAGIQYQLKGFKLGISAKNLFSNKVKIDGEVFLENQRQWYSNISYAFHIRQKLVIAPYVLLYQERQSGLDLGMYLAFFNRVNVSYLYRLKELRQVYTLGVNVPGGFHLGLSLDHSSIYKDKNVDFVIGYQF